MVRHAQKTRVVYAAQVPVGLSQDDLLKPDLWVNIAPRLRPTDQIEVFPEDMAYFARLLVIGVSSAGANLHLLELQNLESSIEEMESSQYDVRWAGPADRFRVVRVSDGHVIEKNFQTKAEGWAFVKNLSPRKLAA